MGVSADRIGEAIGKFRLLGKLGEGGMGVVYVAYDGELDRRVAIKLLRSELSIRPGVRERMLSEAQMLAKLSHPNVLHVYDVGIHRQQIYLALEYVEGEALRAWQARHHGDWRVLVAMYRACGEGLAAAHSAGVVHRDFKPENVLVGVDGRPRVLDFGLATLASASSGVRTHETLGSTQNRGRRVGTPAYMSPEQHAGLEIDARSDQFNFCASLYEALYGVRPFKGTSLQEIGQSMLHGAPVPARGDSPAWLRGLVLRGLALDPDARWPSMQALLDEIDRRARSMAGLWTLSMVLMALLAGTVIALRSGEDICASGTRRVLDLWSVARFARIEAAFIGTGVEDAAEIWGSVRSTIEGQMQEWHGVYNVACMAHSRGEVSDAVYYAQVACLDQRMLALETTLPALEKPSRELVRRARQGLAELQPIGPCGHREQLRNMTPLPTNPALASEVATLQGWLTGDEALRRLELKPPRTQDLPKILARAQVTGHVPLIAKALARVALDAPSSAESERLLLRAVALAEAAGDDTLVADLGNSLVYVMGYRNLRFDEAGRWAALFEAKLQRTRGAGWHRAELEHNRGVIARRRGDDEEARRHFEAAIEISREQSPPDLLRIGINLRYLAAIDTRLGDLDRAEAGLAEAAAMLRATISQEHRQYGLVHLTHGHILMARNRYSAAKRTFAEVHDLWAAAVGPRSMEVVLALNNLAHACISLGEHKEALGYLDRGESILHDLQGDLSVNKAGMLVQRATLERDRQRPDAAESLLRQALEVYTAAYRGDHADLARTMILLGEVSLARGDLAAAERFQDRAQSVIVRLPGAHRLLRAEHALLSAELAIAREHWQNATYYAELARAGYDSQPSQPSRPSQPIQAWQRVRLLFALARAQAAAGAPFEQTYRLAAEAHVAAPAVNADQVALRLKIARWLAATSPGPGRPSTHALSQPPDRSRSRSTR